MCPSSFPIPPTHDAHRYRTAVEILEQVEGPHRRLLFRSGHRRHHLRHRGKCLKAQNPQIEIWAVEPENAAILAGGNIGTICRWASATE